MIDWLYYMFIHCDMGFCWDQVNLNGVLAACPMHWRSGTIWLLGWLTVGSRREKVRQHFGQQRFCYKWCPISGQVVSSGVCRKVLLCHPCLLLIRLEGWKKSAHCVSTTFLRNWFHKIANLQKFHADAFTLAWVKLYFYLCLFPLLIAAISMGLYW